MRGEQGGALLRGELRATGVTATLQLTDQRPAHVRHTWGGRNCPTVAPARMTGPDRPGAQAVWTNGRLLSAGIDSTCWVGTPRKVKTRFQRRVRGLDQLAVAQQEHLLARDVGEQVGELAAVHPQRR